MSGSTPAAPDPVPAAAPPQRSTAALARLLVELAVQSLRAHGNKSLVVGGLMAFSAFVVVVALAFLSSVQESTRASIVESLAGDLQVYASDARDPLALLGGMGFGTDEIGEIDDVKPVLELLRAHDNVAAAVPMGLVSTSVASPGDVDRVLGALRAAVERGDTAEQSALLERVQGIARVVFEQEQKQARMTDALSDEGFAVLARAMAPGFVAEFNADPAATLEWLDTRFAALSDEGGQFFFRLIGTDMTLFRESFSRMKIVEGEMVPPGSRGVLVGKSMIDNRIKLPIAMAFDQIKNERDKGGSIADDRALLESIGRMQRQSSRILTLLAPRDVPAVETALRALMPEHSALDLAGLVRELVSLTDANFDARYRLFYDVIAPRIQLYPFRVGDTITLTAFTRTGFMKSVNVKVWGVYTVEGLENSDLASVVTLADLVTFRTLYGARDAAYDAEIAALRAEVAAKSVTRENVEDALFGDTAVIETVAAAPTPETERAADAAPLATQGRLMDTFDPAVQHSGLALSVAVLLKDPARAGATEDELAALLAPRGLQVVDWQDAVGVLGQMSLVVTAVLFIAILILFLVTIVILNNSLVMATLERVAEFGTLRAIGAQRGFIRAMVVVETSILGVIAALVGAAAGVLVIVWLHRTGVAAPNQILEVMFGGPRMYPTVSAVHVGIALAATTLVGVAATLYPARLATRVQPVVAMQSKD